MISLLDMIKKLKVHRQRKILERAEELMRDSSAVKKRKKNVQKLKHLKDLK